MYIRLLTAILLSALLTATASSQPKGSSKDTESAKVSEPKGPEKFEGKNLHEWLKTATTDPDSAVREQALMAISNFSHSEVRKVCGKTLVSRAGGNEHDNGVRIVLINFIGDLGVEEADTADAVRILASSASTPGVFRFYALQALGKFKSKAYGRINDLNGILLDPSYVIRQTFAKTLGQIGSSETSGPSIKALQMLGSLSKDPCAVVRLAALQSLCSMGPSWAANAKPGVQAEINEKEAQETIDLLKSRIGGKKAATASETDKQIELWCRLVIIRFNPKVELDDQLNGIAAHLSDPEPSVKVQALAILGLLAENAAPKLQDVVKVLDGGGLAESAAALRTRQVVRVAALHTLGAIGGKAIDPILRIIDNPKEYTEIRIAALDALAKLGEKGEAGREILKTIITNDANLKGEGVDLLIHALTALGSMGVKARGSIPELEDLMKRLDKARDKRLASPEHTMMLNSPELKMMLDKLDPDERKKLLDKLLENPEDQFKKGVENTIRYIQESTPGHPGGEHKKP
ncbi:MAG TPA: HEAT repeat domain-containing protein [Gemmata sp.]|jgi:HEAT repeat protein|nr:HEAT repeat domain-containing protein [Gemmata sp.]